MVWTCTENEWTWTAEKGSITQNKWRDQLKDLEPAGSAKEIFGKERWTSWEEVIEEQISED